MKNEKETNGIAFELCKKMIHLQDEVDDGKTMKSVLFRKKQ